MSWDDLQGGGVTYAASPIESVRFGLGMARLTIGWDVRPDGPVAMKPAEDEVTSILRGAAADVVVVRYPAQSLGCAAAIVRSGRQVLPAGSLTYWSAKADEICLPRQDRDVTTRSLNPGRGLVEPWSEVLDDVVADSFAGYGNHYAANPLLDRDRALAGYQEWTRRTALSSTAGALLLFLDERAVGFATLADGDRPEPHVEVLLAGVVAGAQGHGRYATLLHGIAQTALSRRRGRVVISTQSHNVRVQRSWARQGLRPFGAVETVHAVRPGLIT